MPGTLIYFVIFLTIHIYTLFFLGMFSCWVFFLPELVSDSCIWANNFLPARPRVGCRAGFEPTICTSPKTCKISLFVEEKKSYTLPLVYYSDRSGFFCAFCNFSVQTVV
jgi:hypothetical protein